MSDNFPKGKIYKIVNSVNDIVFIGGTHGSITNMLSAYERFDQLSSNNSQSKFIKDFINIGRKKFSVQLIKRVHTTTVKEMNIEKEKVIEEYRKNKIQLYNTRGTKKD